jgi:ketosteroid isomerase-like protein
MAGDARDRLSSPRDRAGTLRWKGLGGPMTSSVGKDRPDAAAIRTVHDTWLHAERTGDIDAILALCSPHIEWRPPEGPPIHGRDAGRKLLTVRDRTLEDLTATDVEVEFRGETAVKTARFESRYAVDGEPARIVTGHHRWTLRQDDSDEWRVTSVAWWIDE